MVHQPLHKHTESYQTANLQRVKLLIAWLGLIFGDELHFLRIHNSILCGLQKYESFGAYYIYIRYKENCSH